MNDKNNNKENKNTSYNNKKNCKRKTSIPMITIHMIHLGVAFRYAFAIAIVVDVVISVVFFPCRLSHHSMHVCA